MAGSSSSQNAWSWNDRSWRKAAAHINDGFGPLLGADEALRCAGGSWAVDAINLLQRRNVQHGTTRWASSFFDRSYPWKALHLADEICEQRRGIVPSPHE